MSRASTVVEHEQTVLKGVRLPTPLVQRIAQHSARLQAQFRFGKITEAMAIRDLLELGLGVAEHQFGTTAQDRQENAENGAPVQRDVPAKNASTDAGGASEEMLTCRKHKKNGAPAIVVYRAEEECRICRRNRLQKDRDQAKAASAA